MSQLDGDSVWATVLTYWLCSETTSYARVERSTASIQGGVSLAKGLSWQLLTVRLFTSTGWNNKVAAFLIHIYVHSPVQLKSEFVLRASAG